MATTAIDIVRANYKRRTEIQGQLRELDEKCTTENRDYTENEAAQVAEFRSELDAIHGRIEANLDEESRSQEVDRGLEHLLGVIADRDSGDVEDTRSLGERFATDEYRSWSQNAAGRSPMLNAEMSFRSVTDVTTGATSGGALTRPDRLARIGSDFPDRKTYLLDLLPVIPTSQGSVEYVQDQSPLADFADKAVEVAEGSAKPQAGPTLAVVTEAVATIAAWVNITRQTAADVPQVMGYLDSKLRYSLKRRADKQAINGDGSSPNLKGLAQRTGILTNAPGSSEDRYITIRHGITLMEQAETVPEIICLNPADAELFDLTNKTSAGIHVQPENVAGLQRVNTAWGLQQVRSNAIAAGTALLIDPMTVAVIDRMQATAYMTDSHASNFTSNLLTLLLESRLGLALFDPKGVLKITFHD